MRARRSSRPAHRRRYEDVVLADDGSVRPLSTLSTGSDRERALSSPGPRPQGKDEKEDVVLRALKALPALWAGVNLSSSAFPFFGRVELRMTSGGLFLYHNFLARRSELDLGAVICYEGVIGPQGLELERPSVLNS